MTEFITAPIAQKKYTSVNLPPEGDKEVGTFFYKLFEDAYRERLRLNLEDRWFENHRLFRGSKGGINSKTDARDSISTQSNRHKFPINLFFANVQRTVANITARTPVAEVVVLDGNEDGSDLTLSAKIKLWWNETEQGITLARSTQNSEIYGITIEKAVYNLIKKRTDIIVLDPYAFLPAPGYYEDLNDCPYVIHMYPDAVESIEAMFGVEGVQADDVYSILGENREDNRPIPSGMQFGSQNYPGNYSSNYQSTINDKNRQPRALVIEIWCKDNSTRKEIVNKPIVDPLSGQQLLDEYGNPQMMQEEIETPVYPGGIRVITLTNRGNVVLDDKKNPNINLELPIELYSQTYLYDKYPLYKTNSYEDTTSLWGFSSAEQTGDIMNIISETLSRVAFYLARVATPILIIPRDTGITKQMITNKPGLIIQPASTAVSSGIRFLQIPNLPSNYFDILEVYTKYFDRISQIEDADRGAVPDRVVSGAAIQSLQERGAVLIRAKIRGVDIIVRERGRCAISFYQNFGIDMESLSVQGETQTLRGIELAGRKYNFVVESGSTVAKTSFQVQEQAMLLYDKGVIDRIALLETLNFPKWREIVERVGEGQLSQALSILIEAGMPEQMADALKEELSKNQGGPGTGNKGNTSNNGGGEAAKKAGRMETSSPTQIRGALNKG